MVEKVAYSDPNEKPTLPAFGGVDPLLLPGAMLNLNNT